MLRFIFYLILFVGSVWLGLKITADPGYALFSYQHWSMEMPLWLVAVFFILGTFIFSTIIGLLRSFSKLLHRFGNSFKNYHRIKSQKYTKRGLIELAEGHWKLAEKNLIRGAEFSETPLINYLSAARAAQEQGHYETRDRLLKQAHLTNPQAQIAIGLTQAELQFNHHQLEQGLATLKHLKSIVPNHAHVLKLMALIYEQLQDWKNLHDLLAALRKYKIFSLEELEKITIKTYAGLLQNIKLKTSAELYAQWIDIPKTYHKNPNLIESYTARLIAIQEGHIAEPVLRGAINSTFNEELISRYGKLKGKDPKRQLHYAEQWLKQHPNNHILLTAIGRIALENKLWGKARSYFEASLQAKPTPETYRELGQLFEQLGDHNSAMECFRKGLLAATE